MKRAVILTALVTLGLLLLASAVSHAANLGSDPFRDLTGTEADGLMGRYPLSSYALDTYIDTNDVLGVTVPGDRTGEAWLGLLSSGIVQGTLFITKFVIMFLTLGFDMDLLAPGGMSDPIRSATNHLQHQFLGYGFLAVALMIGAGVVAKKAFVDQRHGQALSTGLRSFLCIMIALGLLINYDGTVGYASRVSNALTTGILVGGNADDLKDAKQAKLRIQDNLWRAWGLNLWTATEFGGLRHCVDTTRRDKAGYPTPVEADSPRRTVCRDHITKGRDGKGGYAHRFLAQSHGSKARKLEFTALRDGKVPDDADCSPGCDLAGQFGVNAADPHQFDGYKVDKSDSPAADRMQEGSALVRFGMAVVFLFLSFGFWLVFGGIAVALILVSAGALLVLALTPVALICGAVPGRGHQLFDKWFMTLFGLILVKVLYALLATVLTTFSNAFTAAMGTKGWLFAFGLQGVGLIVLFFKGPKLLKKWGAAPGMQSGIRGHAERSVATGAAVLAAPVVAGREFVNRHREKEVQETFREDHLTEHVPGRTDEQGEDGTPIPSPAQPTTANLGADEATTPVQEPRTVEPALSGSSPRDGSASPPRGGAEAGESPATASPRPPAVPTSPEGQEAQRTNLPLADGKPAVRTPTPAAEFPGLNTPESVVSPQRRGPMVEDILLPDREYKGPQ